MLFLQIKHLYYKSINVIQAFCIKIIYLIFYKLSFSHYYFA